MQKRPTIAFLRECLVYDPALGVVWQHRPVEHFINRAAQIAWNAKMAARRAGTVQVSGHRAIVLTSGDHRYRLYEHHVVWALHHGEWPGEIDHRDGVKTNNDPENLREATSGQNKQNLLVDDATGTTFHKKTGKWRAYIKLNRRQIHLGLFDTQEQAHQAYLDAKAKLHPFQPVPRRRIV